VACDENGVIAMVTAMAEGGKGCVCDVQLYLSPTVFGALTGGKPGGAQTHSQFVESLLDNGLMMMSIVLVHH
jgi:hypothetical protein